MLPGSPAEGESGRARRGGQGALLGPAGVRGPSGTGSGAHCAAVRLDAFIATESRDADARQLLKRLRRTRDHLFTFLDYPQIPFENNFAERQIRPAVILRKNSQSNRSDRGARTQAVLMSVYRALRLRGHDPLQTIANALRAYLQTGQLSPLLAPTIAGG